MQSVVAVMSSRSLVSKSSLISKYDPLLNLEMLLPVIAKVVAMYQKADVNAEFWPYNSITGVDLQQPDAVRSVFDPLLWWGQQSFNFPILSCLGWQV